MLKIALAVCFTFKELFANAVKPTEIRADVVHNVCVGLVTYIDNGTTSFALYKRNYLFNSTTRYYKKVATGTSDSMKNISREQMYMLALPLPPLAEQKRIVEKVERLLQHIKQLEEQVSTAQAQAQQLLHAVLQEAFAPAKEYPMNETLMLAAEE